MLEAAGPDGSPQSASVLLNGKLPDGTYIHLDLELQPWKPMATA
jgi:hypothetical protein